MVWSLGQEDPLEKDMATHSSTFTWRIPWTEEPGKLQSMGSHRDRHDWVTNTFTFNSSGSRSNSQNIKHLVWCKHGWNRTDNQPIRVDASYALPKFQLSFSPVCKGHLMKLFIGHWGVRRFNTPLIELNAQKKEISAPFGKSRTSVLWKRDQQHQSNAIAVSREGSL